MNDDIKSEWNILKKGYFYFTAAGGSLNSNKQLPTFVFFIRIYHVLLARYIL